MKICVIYHSIDLDGWMSAAIVKYWFEKTMPKGIEYTFAKPMNDGQSGKKIWHSQYDNCKILNFIGYNYGDTIPDLSDYDKVIMCDISFPKEEMTKLFNKFDTEFIWIDHHKSAIIDNGELDEYGIEDISTLYNGLRKTDFAACELTWMYFFPNEPMPEIVRLLGRYDCFGHKTKSFEMISDGYNKAKEYLNEVDLLKEFENNKTSNDGYSLVYYANDIAKKLSEEQKVLEFQYGARQCISNYEEAYKYLMQSFDPLNPDIENISYHGALIYEYLCTEAKQTYKNGFPILFEHPRPDVKDMPGDNYTCFEMVKFICINKERFNPINFGINYHEDGYDGCACFHRRSDGKWAFSLYNDNGLVDCSMIAKQFGGGGHKGAAGFVADNNEFLNIIK